VDAKELPALLRAIEIYQGKHVTRLAMKLLAMTFVRTSELIGARWDEFDLEACRWNIPAERMKMKTPHIVPLAPQTIEVLTLLKQLSVVSELVFPGDRDHRKPMSNNTILLAPKRMGYGGDMTGHGFRGLASTILHEQGWPARAYRIAARPCPAQRHKRCLQSCAVPGAASEDDARVGRIF
jgi:integrase